MQGSSPREMFLKQLEGGYGSDGHMSSSSSSDKEKDKNVNYNTFPRRAAKAAQDSNQQLQQVKKSYEERVKEVREKEARERQKKLEQMLTSLQRAEEIRKKHDEERMKKRREMKQREDEHRQLVDGRRKKMEVEDTERKQAKLKKYEELTRKITDWRTLPKLSPVTFRKTASDETDMGDDVEMQLPVRPRPHSNPTRLPSYASSTYTSNLRSGRSPQKAPVERKVSTPRLVSASPELSRRALRSGDRSRTRHRNHSGANRQLMSPVTANNINSESVMISSTSRITSKTAPEREVYVMSRSLEAAYLSSMFDSRPQPSRRYLPQIPASSTSRIARPMGVTGDSSKSTSRESPKPGRKLPNIGRESPKPSKLPTAVRARSAPAGVRFSETPSPPISAVVWMEASRCGTRSQMSSPCPTRRGLKSKIPKVLPAEPNEGNRSQSKGTNVSSNMQVQLQRSSSTSTSPRPALRKFRHRRSASSPSGAVRQVTFTPDIMAAGGDSADEEAKEREYKRKLAERRLIERERRAELSQAAERKVQEEAERLSAEELKRRQEVAQKIEAEKKAEEERLMKMMEDEYKSKLEQMERLEKKRQASRRAYEERIERERQEYRQKQEEERLERRRKFELIKQRLKSELAEGKPAQITTTIDPTSTDVIKIVHDPVEKADSISGIPRLRSARLNQILQRSPSSDEAL